MDLAEDLRRDDEDPRADHRPDDEGGGVEAGDRFDEIGLRLLGRGHRVVNLVAPAKGRYVLGRHTPPLHARTTVRLLPREEEFFDLFVEVATRNKVAAQHLRDLFDVPPERRIAHVDAIKRLEHEADQVTHEVVNRLDRTFITPLDREVIKWKEIYDTLERTLDESEDVANVLESITLKHA